jgi:twitching motility protein PilT
MPGGPEDLSRLVRQLNTSAGALKSAGSTGDTDQAGSVQSHFDEILRRAVSSGASDILFVAGFPTVLRVHGALTPFTDEPLTPHDTKALARLLLSDLRYPEFLREKASDFSFERNGLGRFRCDLHHQQGSIAIAIRVLPSAIPTLRELNLPEHFERFARMTRGLVLFCGPTGCGKSTTMASLIDIINRTRAAHIVTIEDPIEYVHPPALSVVEQVEIGRDATSFASALRHALRQDPDVILVGEMRDLETISIALTAAETGHLVFSTLHTADAPQTVDRLIDVFPEQQQRQIRQQVSLSLSGIAVQTLVPTRGGDGRLPAAEILIANDAVRNLIRTGQNHQIHSQITIGRKDGMMTMEDSLAALVRAGRISRDEAVLRAGHRDELENLVS